MAPALRIRFWGVRGSHPAPGRSHARIGGNSSCVEVATAEHTLVFDAGTGIIPLGRELVRSRRPATVHVFISHTHHDHVEGLRFFEPAYRPEWHCHLYGSGPGTRTLHRVLRSMMEPQYFPFSFDELSAAISIRNLGSRERVRLGGRPPVAVTAQCCHAHPKIGVILYRVTCAGRSVVYASDVEAGKGGHDAVVQFARGADVLIHDAQYTEEEYFSAHSTKAGWGHSTVRMASEVAAEAGVGRLVLFHHDPSHDDRLVHRLEREAQRTFPATQAAYEGLDISLPARPRRAGNT